MLSRFSIIYIYSFGILFMDVFLDTGWVFYLFTTDRLKCHLLLLCEWFLKLFLLGCSYGTLLLDSYGKPWYRMGTFFLGTIFALSFENLKALRPRRVISLFLSFFGFAWVLFGLWYAIWLPQIYNWRNNPRNPENHASQKTQRISYSKTKHYSE